MTATTALRSEHDSILAVIACVRKACALAIPAGADAGTGARYEELAAALCRRWDVDPADAARTGGGGFGCHPV